MPELLFVIPMKDPQHAKTRLASVLPPEARQRLAMALFRQVLEFLIRHQSGHGVLVVTSSGVVKACAQSHGAVVLDEVGTGGLSAAVQQGADWAVAEGYRAICVLPADLADPEAADLQKLLSYPRPSPSLILAPAHNGGTNCLIASPPDAVRFHYGEGSCQAHQLAAEERGIPCTIAPLCSLAYDIDTGQDLAGSRWQNSKKGRALWG
ncbi:MAG: 2-phospho-L-lactate guanylyltransferase [Rhodobacterales bacterium]|nr:MAG: 2-phospho-L-lactate guanylyltransferase [Rhodobacterales bacterium]